MADAELRSTRSAAERSAAATAAHDPSMWQVSSPNRVAAFTYGTTEANADMVNAPPHYTRGPQITVEHPDGTESIRTVECIEVLRHIQDYRLAQAMRYVWRVAFGGKWDDVEDIDKGRWYLSDFLDHPRPKE